MTIKQLLEVANNSMSAAAMTMDLAGLEAVATCAPDEIGEEAEGIANAIRSAQERIAALYRASEPQQEVSA